MMFICEDCAYKCDYDEGEDEIIECSECGGNMYSDITMTNTYA